MNADGVDLSAAEAYLGLPIAIPVRPAGPDAPLVSDTADATFSWDRITFGIGYSIENVERFRGTQSLRGALNESLLHELVHVRQWFDDPRGFADRVERELATHDYDRAPHEVEARQLACEMLAAGVRVYFPEQAVPDESSNHQWRSAPPTM